MIAPRNVVTIPSISTRQAIWRPLQPTAERIANSERRSITAISSVFITPIPPITSASTAITSAALETRSPLAPSRIDSSPSAMIATPG